MPRGSLVAPGVYFALVRNARRSRRRRSQLLRLGQTWGGEIELAPSLESFLHAESASSCVIPTIVPIIIIKAWEIERETDRASNKPNHEPRSKIDRWRNSNMLARIGLGVDLGSVTHAKRSVTVTVTVTRTQHLQNLESHVWKSCGFRHATQRETCDSDVKRESLTVTTGQSFPAAALRLCDGQAFSPSEA
jgi:hypothetical protein